MAILIETAGLHVRMNDGKVWDGLKNDKAPTQAQGEGQEIHNLQSNLTDAFMNAIRPSELNLQDALQKLVQNNTDPATLAKFQMDFASFSTLTAVSTQVSKTWKDNQQGLARAL